MLRIFISYAREDQKWADLIRGHIRASGSDLDVWVDVHDLRLGTEWRHHVDSAIALADLAILVVSRDFLESTFIQSDELPALRARRIPLFPVIASPCGWTNHDWIKSLQVAPRQKTLKEFGTNKRDMEIVQLVDEIRKFLRGSPPVPIEARNEIPSHPGYYVHRPALTSQVVETLKAGGSEPACVIWGPSGYGKTNLAIEVARQFEPSVWFDPLRPGRHVVSKGTGALVVVDNADALPRDAVRQYDWLRQTGGPVLVAARQPTSVRVFLSDLGRANAPAIEVGGFSAEECRVFLSKGIPQQASGAVALPEGNLLALNAYMQGCPALWQVIRDLVLSESLDASIFQADDPGDLIKVRQQVFRVWLSERQSKNRLTSDVLQVLCCQSMLAASSEAIGFVIDRDPSEVDDCLEPFRELGFVRRAGWGDDSWIPHDLLREACRCVHGEVSESGNAVAKYARFLPHTLAKRDASSRQFLTLVDSWLFGMGRLFFGTSNSAGEESQAFFSRYSELLRVLGRMFEEAERDSLSARWLADLFRSRICALHCYQIIPLAQVIARLPNKNRVYGDIMWLATGPDAIHKDTWAQSESIHAAAVQWSNQNPAARRECAALILDAIGDCLGDGMPALPGPALGEVAGECGPNRNLPRFDHLVVKMSSDEIREYALELILAALITGLCILDFPELAMDYLDEDRFRSKYPNVYLAVLLWYLEHRPAGVEQFLSNYWWMIQFCELKPFVERYLNERKIPVHQTVIGEMALNPNRIHILGEMSGNHGFLGWLSAFFAKCKWIDVEKRLLKVDFREHWGDLRAE